MKPLTNIEAFLKRFDYFKSGEFRSIEIISPTTITATLAGQDSARAHDWISIQLEFNGVSDAKLLNEAKLKFLDMDDGITMVQENKSLAFAIGNCNNISAVQNASCYIICSNIKYEEGSF